MSQGDVVTKYFRHLRYLCSGSTGNGLRLAIGCKYSVPTNIHVFPEGDVGNRRSRPFQFPETSCHEGLAGEVFVQVLLLVLGVAGNHGMFERTVVPILVVLACSTLSILAKVRVTRKCSAVGSPWRVFYAYC